jgi:tRNA threonylcarbamoyladenosine modification (KEOPS) complex Cgi121 subunit
MTKPESYYTTHKIDGFEDEFEIHLMLFEEVKNAREISESIKSGKFDIELALMNPKTVFSENIICLAAFKAIASMQTNQMVTKTLHSEVIFNCAPKTNINEAFRRFGASADSQAMIVARVVNIKDTKKRNNNNYDNNNNNNNSEDRVEIENNKEREKIRKWIDGNEIKVTKENLNRFADTQAIQKYYNIQGEELKISTLEDSVLMRIGAREVI